MQGPTYPWNGKFLADNYESSQSSSLANVPATPLATLKVSIMSIPTLHYDFISEVMRQS